MPASTSQTYGDNKLILPPSRCALSLRRPCVRGSCCTDGEDHVGTPVEVSREIAKDGVKVFTVGIGSDSPELIPRYLGDGTSVHLIQTTESGIHHQREAAPVRGRNVISFRIVVTGKLNNTRDECKAKRLILTL